MTYYVLFPKNNFDALEINSKNYILNISTSYELNHFPVLEFNNESYYLIEFIHYDFAMITELAMYRFLTLHQLREIKKSGVYEG